MEMRWYEKNVLWSFFCYIPQPYKEVILQWKVSNTLYLRRTFTSTWTNFKIQTHASVQLKIQIQSSECESSPHTLTASLAHYLPPRWVLFTPLWNSTSLLGYQRSVQRHNGSMQLQPWLTANPFDLAVYQTIGHHKELQRKTLTESFSQNNKC